MGVFLLVGLSLLVLGRPFLGYPPAWSGGLILLIETAAMLAIAATLVLAFLGGRPQPARLDATDGKPVTVSISTLRPKSRRCPPGADTATGEYRRHVGGEKRPC